MEDFSLALLTAAGVGTEDARAAHAALIYADQRGLGTHGLSKLPIYLKRIRSGAIDGKVRPAVSKRENSLALIDGKNALGPVVATRTADEAMSLAKERGLGAAFARNSNHFGVTAYYASRGLKDGLIGLAMTNANPTMAPWGAKKALVGTNPLAVAVPTGKGAPIVLDMASSLVARGKIVMAAEENRPLPKGWALDADGNETTDAHAALKGLLAPLGGPKGSGLAIAIDILCGVLSGSHFLDQVGHLYTDLNRAQGLGHLVIALRIDWFMPLPVFYAIMDGYIASVKSCPPAAGVDRIYLPGEIEYRKSEECRANGVPLAPATVKELNELAGELGIEPLEP